MNIRILFTKSGQIIGDFTENFEGEKLSSYTIHNPVLLVQTQQGVQFIPVLMLTEDKEIEVGMHETLFNGQTFTPMTEMRNQYSSMFGSGIQLLSK